MLDIRRLRTEPDAVRAGLSRRGGDAAAHVDRILELDEQQRALGTERDDLRARIKVLSKEVGQRRGQGDADGRRGADGREPGARRAGEGARRARSTRSPGRCATCSCARPNVPSADCPDGAGEADNVVLRIEGFDPDAYGAHQRVPHWDIGTELGILDGERAAKIAGSMFTMYRGWGARLLRAMVQLSLDRNADAYEEIRPPTLVRTDTMIATGHLPKFEEEAYHMERDDLWAIPTAEVPLTSLHRDEVLDDADLPLRYTAHTSCFRREAGAAGRDTRGLLRVARVRQGRAARASPTAPSRPSPARRTSSPAARRCSPSSGSPTGSSTCAPATSARRRRAPGTSRPTRRAATCGSR